MKTSNIVSKSKFTCGDSCLSATLNCFTRPNAATMPDMSYILDNGTEVGKLARKLYPEAVTVESDDHATQIAQTSFLLEKGTKIICEAAFEIDNLFCAVDILKVNSPGHVEIMEVKSSTKIKDIFYRDLAFQVYVVSKCGLKVDSAQLIYVNSEYVRDGEIDPNQYFVMTDVSEDVFNLQDTINSEVSAISKALDENEEIVPTISECCFKPYACPFWEKVCKPTLPENSVFDISGGMHIATKLKLFYSGTHTMEDFLTLKRQNPKYVQQCQKDVNNDDNIEVKLDELNAFLSKINYPMISLDFETIIEAIQLFDGQKPYDQTVFQFSMHVLRERGGNLEHFEYLADPTIDWREQLAHELVRCCPAEGTVLVWNEAMEKNRIKELAEMDCNQDIKDELLSITDRILDLMVPFRTRVIYQRKMHGSYSIKKVLPALCDREELSYANLSINNGMLASMTFSNMVHNKPRSDLELSTNRRNLLTYCELDTYAPFCILEVLYKLVDPTATDLFKKTEKHDNTHRTILVGDRVSTNVGNGYVVGFTTFFVKVRLDAGYVVLRIANNLYNMSKLNISRDTYCQDFTDDCDFSDVTGRKVKIGDFVVTNAHIGQVVGKTNYFLKVRLLDGKIILRRSNFVIIG